MANTSTLKKIVAEAKRIQKAHPHMEWKNAIKDASKHIKEGAKTVIKKKTTKKGVGYADDRIELLRKTTPIIKKLKDKGLTRTKAIKKINKSAKSIGTVNSSNELSKLQKTELFVHDLIRGLEQKRIDLKRKIAFNGKLGEHFYTRSEISLFRKEIAKINKMIVQLKKVAKEQEKAKRIL